MTKRSYSQVLPFNEEDTVKNQFGWLPVSVFKPDRGEEWRDADILMREDSDIVRDSGDVTTRRGEDCKYLPGLRFSEFHPQLAEMVIKYWSTVGALIVDPFAGRATRGTVALSLRRKYQGYEVAPTTFAATKEKVESNGGELVCEDGCVMPLTKPETADLVFTCPPYHRLEQYESALFQLSDVVAYEDFLSKIRQCSFNIYRVLKPGGFLVWVCGDWRDGKAFRTFHADSLRAFLDVGLIAHDIVIVHNNSPFAPLQAAKVASKRYTAKIHEYCIVMRKI